MKIGIIICDRYKSCAGGKCLRSMRNREGAFDIYDKDISLELVGYTSCGGCPGGNIEYAAIEMLKNGVEAIHFATGFIVGYPPCPHIAYFKNFIEQKFSIPVVYGTHPIPENYLSTHNALQTWNTQEWTAIIQPTMADEKLRRLYD